MTAQAQATTLHGIVLGWFDSSVYTLVYCGLIVVVFAAAWRYLKRERDHLAALNSYIMMKYRLGVQVEIKSVAREVVADITRIEDASNPVRRQTGIEALWKRAVRLEGSVNFWVDFLQKLGLLGTVLGLGFALALRRTAADNLLEPLSMAVWSTVLGLVCSMAVSWRFGRDVDVEVDLHEEHLKEWQVALGAGKGQPAALLGAPAAPDELPG